MKHISAEQFAEFAGSDISRWRLLEQHVLHHPKFGTGTIISVVSLNANLIINVRFDELIAGINERKFELKVLGICGGIFLPFDLAATVLSQESPASTPTPAPTNQQPATPSTPELPNPQFESGQEVVVHANRERGMITKPPFWSQVEWQYEVFFSGRDRRIYRESDLSLPKYISGWSDRGDLLRNLAFIKLRRPLSDNLYGLYGSRTQFEVYQFRPAVKFLNNPDQRLLIADEVGLGKTIEAGIIYLELQARLDLNQVLVVCPSSLRFKWQDEMKLRFDEEFDILDANAFRRLVDRNKRYRGQSRLRGIISLELIRRRDFADMLETLQMSFDLVIIDEAHHCRNSSTLSHNIATVLSENADAMLLLTATPLQIGDEDLFSLLRILSPGEFDNLEVFRDRLEPNQFVNRSAQILATGDHRRALKELLQVEKTKARRRFFGNPYYQEVLHHLRKSSLTSQELVLAQRRLVELNTLATIFTRTRKREIAEHTATRAAFTLQVRFTPVEARFYQAIIHHVRQEFARLHGKKMVSGWVSIMRERQAASCISAARQRFADIATETDLNSEEEASLDTAVVNEWDESDLRSGRKGKHNWFRRWARETPEPPVDSKFNVFRETLQKVLAEDETTKVLVFSFFRDTIDYLYRQLRRLGVGVLQIHGGFKVTERPGIIDRFRSEPNIRVLISSEVGAEGLDFQFCNTIFNYDLPWNPMRVEQRIGRVDRFGQKSAKIRIYNLIIEDSIESRILKRLYDRIGLFQRAIGDIEAILGEEIRELSRQVYTAELSPSEEEALAEQAAQNIIRRQQEMEDFEKKRLQFMGQEAIFSTLVNQTIESGNFVSDVEVRGLVETFIKAAFPRSQLSTNRRPRDGTYALDVNTDLVMHMRDYIVNKMPYDKTAQSFLGKITPGKILPVTFSSEMASQRKLLQFITPRHPLSQAAIAYWNKDIDPVNKPAYFGLKTNDAPPGLYYLFLFELEARGAEQTYRLVPVVVLAENGDVHTALSQKVMRLIQSCSYAPMPPYPSLENDDFDEAERVALLYMTLRRNELETEIKRANSALVNARRTAKQQSFEAKFNRVEEAHNKAKDQRIRRMREVQMRNLRAGFEMSLAEIENLRNISVSFSLVLKGCLTITVD